MLVYLYCAADTRMTMNESLPPCDQRCITKSNVKVSLKRFFFRQVSNLIVSDIDLSSFGKLFHEAGPAYEKARSLIL